MNKIDLKELEKQIDDYFDNLTEETFIENMRKEGINIDEELEKNGVQDELENGDNTIIIPVRKRPKPKKPRNKGFNNQSMRRRH